MLGLPTVTQEDIEGIAILANQICATFFDEIPKEDRKNGKVNIVASTSFFVPKPFTPFQWAKQCTKEEFLDKSNHTRKAISSQLNQKSIRYNWHEADTSVLEGALARGDRRLGDVILRAYQKGCIFDAWSEHFDHTKWLEAFEECNVSIDFYTARERAEDELFPWDFIDAGVTKAFLLREWKKALRGETSPNCREQCNGCGLNCTEAISVTPQQNCRSDYL
jgi:radical SAM superfamily enzyme YgiQ (UPF0313 family)